MTAPKDQIPVDADVQRVAAESLLTTLSLPGSTAAERASAQAALDRLPAAIVARARTKAGLPASQASGATTMAAVPQVIPGATYSKFLTMPHATQLNGYYCGPASAYMVLATMQKTRSKSGVTLSQKNLAGTAYLKTDLNKGTPWASRNMANGLNAWLGTKTYTQAPVTNIYVLQGSTYNSVNKKVPLLADTVEHMGGIHYNRHPQGKTIGHWIANYGYSAYGRTGYWHDPAQNVWPNVSVPTTFGYSSDTFAKNFLLSNGIALS